MRFRMKCAHIGETEGWWEDYDENTDDAQAYAENLIARFNDTLRPGERPRQLLEVEVLDGNPNTTHEWEKISLVTERGRDGRLYDRYRCVNCGITARRYGLNRTPTRDPEYKAKVYESCDTARAHLKGNRHAPD